jgi:hypothetical protein
MLGMEPHLSDIQFHHPFLVNLRLCSIIDSCMAHRIIQTADRGLLHSVRNTSATFLFHNCLSHGQAIRHHLRRYKEDIGIDQFAPATSNASVSKQSAAKNPFPAVPLSVLA